MAHDPLCDWLQETCTPETCPGLRLGDHCKHEWCQCELIAKVRADQDRIHREEMQSLVLAARKERP